MARRAAPDSDPGASQPAPETYQQQAEAYQQPSAASYQQYYQQPAERTAADNAQHGRSDDEGETHNRR